MNKIKFHLPLLYPLWPQHRIIRDSKLDFTGLDPILNNFNFLKEINTDKFFIFSFCYSFMIPKQSAFHKIVVDNIKMTIKRPKGFLDKIKKRKRNWYGLTPNFICKYQLQTLIRTLSIQLINQNLINFFRNLRWSLIKSKSKSSLNYWIKS